VAPELKPAYLIWGDDEIRLDAWRRRLRARVAAERSSATLELLRDEHLSGTALAGAISALTLSVGCRYVLADGIERWKERDVKEVAAALAAIPPGTVVVLIATGEAPAGLAKAVEKVGGEVHAYEAPKLAAYPAWVRQRARELGLALDRDAAQALVERVPHDDRRRPRQQCLLRELEKLAVFAGERELGVEDVDALTVPIVDARVYELADAVIEADPEGALRIAEDLRGRGEDIMHILFALLRQLRQCRRAWALVSSGKSLREVQSELRVPQWAARRIVAQARRADPEQLERALDVLADLDYAIRGAGQLDADSALTIALARATTNSEADVAAAGAQSPL
jgi:DNA polymerase-3 subunit delta